MSGGFLLLALALGAACATAAASPHFPLAEGVAPVHWRSLLQSTGGPKTVVVANLNTAGQPVFCVNITQPFQNKTYPASGSASPSGASVDALAQLICSNYQAAGRQFFLLIQAGGDQATQAAAALKQARCSDPDLVPKAVTVASVQAQDTLGSLQDIEAYFQALVTALAAVGVPACVTLVESDQSGHRVAAEKYFQNS